MAGFFQFVKDHEMISLREVTCLWPFQTRVTWLFMILLSHRWHGDPRFSELSYMDLFFIGHLPSTITLGPRLRRTRKFGVAKCAAQWRLLLHLHSRHVKLALQPSKIRSILRDIAIWKRLVVSCVFSTQNLAWLTLLANSSNCCHSLEKHVTTPAKNTS